MIVAEALAAKVSTETGPDARREARVVQRRRARTPQVPASAVRPRFSCGVLADYVTLDQGTGAVHTAPGHGADDFATGVRYGLEIYAPIGRNGRFDQDVGIVAGMKVFEANPAVEAALAERGRLWFSTKFQHSYPHCWRCHQPVIFLATSQWFISMDGAARSAAVEECNRVRWIPEWGRERMSGMFRQSAGLVHLAPARLGCADPGAAPARPAVNPSSRRRLSSTRPKCSSATTPTPGTTAPPRRSCPMA